MKTITLSALTAEALEMIISNYMKEYHPAGYGTFVDKRWNEDHQFHAKLCRYSSCD